MSICINFAGNQAARFRAVQRLISLAVELSFSDTSVAFSYKSDKELRKSHFLFQSINSPVLAKLGTNIVKFGFKIKAPIKPLIRTTIFWQFCGGESIDDCSRTIAMLAQYNLRTILDYAVEGESGEVDFDRTAEEIHRTIDRAAGDPSIPFCVFKPTGLAPIDLLTRVQAAGKPTSADEAELDKVRKRWSAIAAHCSEAGVQLFIDSEHSYIQEPIDQLVYELMETYNREKPVVCNTYQLYRVGMLERLRAAVETGRKKGYWVGVKLVRGAYMEKERLRAAEMGYDDPIMPDKAATDRQYDDALRYCLEQIDVMSVCSGSHNEESNYLLARLVDEHGLKRNDPRIYFAQLYGMSDNISFNLAKAGYNVVKYLPYGPVEAVLPYLFRRAEENTSIAGQSSRELELLRKELRRRRIQD